MKILNSTRQTVPIKDVILGDRFRHDLGNIEEVAYSIDEVGLLHPIVIRSDCTLISGKRRLEAAKALGWQEIPVTVIDLDDIVRGQFAENMHRKDFLPSEIDAIRRELEPAEKAAAKQRQGTRNDKHPGKLPGSAGRARDKIAAFVGLSGRTVQKIAAVVDAAKADSRFIPFVEMMDRTGHVNGAYRQLRVAQQSERLRKETPPLPQQGPYRVIVIDAPWRFAVPATDTSRTTPYPTMTIKEIAALPVVSIAHADCVLWLWTTNVHLPDAFQILSAWGFEYKTMLTWAKPHFGVGNWLRGQTEHCLLATRGKPTVQLTNQSTLLNAARGKHSEKPAEFYDLVESLCPASRYASLFHCGASRPNWDAHGDEAGPVSFRSTSYFKRCNLMKPVRSLNGLAGLSENAARVNWLRQ